MPNQLQTTADTTVLSALVLSGDLSRMNDNQKVIYYRQFCASLGLNPLTQPFKIIKFQGRETLYATKDCTEQLRKIHGISVVELSSDMQQPGIFMITCKVKDVAGKTDISSGVVTIEGLKGDNLANALMKAETKAKRRATLSICGLGMLDESEIETIDTNAQVMDIPQAKKSVLSEKAFAAAVVRINKGEMDLIGKLREECSLTDTQQDILLQLEDANVVPHE
jgi:hypothetical protein